MRRTVLILAWLLVSTVLLVRTVWAQIPPADPLRPLGSLKAVPIPEPPNLAEFVQDKQAAIRLGKALFWDTQVGSDNRVACASCHFAAGADTRTKNQLNPGAGDTIPATFQVGGPNHFFQASDFPFTKHAIPNADESPLTSDTNDIAGSQGVHARSFTALSVDADDCNRLASTVFHLQGNNTRQVTGRNAPSVINAVFNVRNFWDGRANSEFNGVNPFGRRDPNAGLWRAINPAGDLEKQRVLIPLASLASQAVGPPGSDVEMACAGRSFALLGAKLLAPGRVPLATQMVNPQDSVLGANARSALDRAATGLNVSYAELIQQAFKPELWNSTNSVTLDNTQFTQMQANFSLFFGLAIQLYEATLVSDDSPMDRFFDGDPNALTPLELQGMATFNGQGGCINCHGGPETTNATIGNGDIRPLERMVMGDGGCAVYDNGFYNIGVRPTEEDLGAGGNDPFGNPLALSKMALTGQFTETRLVPAFGTVPGCDERVVVDGTFKTPGLRNVELTAPYFHNGGKGSLGQVVDLYNRGGDFATQNAANLAADIRFLGLTDGQKESLVAFMMALTDERVRLKKAPFDHPELCVVNGHLEVASKPGEEPPAGGEADDEMFCLPATGAAGTTQPPPAFLGISPFAHETVDAELDLGIGAGASFAGKPYVLANSLVTLRVREPDADDPIARQDITLIGPIDGENTVFTVPAADLPLFAIAGDVAAVKGTTITPIGVGRFDAETGEITLLQAPTPAMADRITLDYTLAVTNSINVKVSSNADSAGYLMALTETSPTSGVFEGTLRLVGTASDRLASPPSLLAPNGDVVKLLFVDNTPTTGAVATLSASLKVDGAGPTVSGASPVSIATNNRRPTFRATITDGGSGVDPASIRLQVPSGQIVIPGISGVAGGYIVEYTPATNLTPANVFAWVVSARDHLGNAVGRTLTFKMDVTLPSISGASPVNVATNNRRPIFRATITDKGSGIDPASIALEVPIGTTITPHVSPIAGGYTIVYTPTADLAPAQPLTWRLSAVDGAGNQQGKQFSFKLDTTLPVISGASPVNVATNNRRPIFRATITDPGTGINPATIIIKMPTGTLVRPSLTVVPDGYTLAYTPTADLVQATPFRWDVSARDIAGNRMVSKFSFYLDTTLPAISGASPVNIATNNRRPTFQATLIDLGAQIDPASIRLEIPVGRRVTPVRTAITNGYAIQWTPPVSLAPNSAYPWKITVRDRAGNERSQQFTFNLDVALPVISAVSPVNVTTANRRPVFKATVTDVGSGINPARVAIEVPLGTAVRPILTPVAGGYTIEYTPSVDLSPASPFVWRITVWDRAGNGISKQFSFTLVP